MRVSNAWSSRLSIGLVLAALCTPLLGCTQPSVTTSTRVGFNVGSNAAWLGVEWVDEVHRPEQVRQLANDLDRRQIETAFVYATYLAPDGQFVPSYSHARAFIRELKRSKPDIVVLAWIGLPLSYVDLADSTARDRIVSLCALLCHEHGFDGVHLDAEPVEDGDAAVLLLLDEVRQGIGHEATLSIATRRISPIAWGGALPLVGRLFWTADYYRQVAQRVDQIAIMTYDSGLPLAFLYRAWTKRQVIRISQALEGTQVELYIGVPTSEEWTLTHWPSAENMRSGLQGTTDGLNDRSARPGAVTGVAIYPYWETDADEWATYELMWLSR